MKKTIALLLTALLCLGLFSGCTKPATAGGSDDGTYFVGALYDSLQVESRVRQKNELERYGAELGMKIVFRMPPLTRRSRWSRPRT